MENTNDNKYYTENTQKNIENSIENNQYEKKQISNKTEKEIIIYLIILGIILLYISTSFIHYIYNRGAIIDPSTGNVLDASDDKDGDGKGDNTGNNNNGGSGDIDNNGDSSNNGEDGNSGENGDGDGNSNGNGDNSNLDGSENGNGNSGNSENGNNGNGENDNQGGSENGNGNGNSGNSGSGSNSNGGNNNQGGSGNGDGNSGNSGSGSNGNGGNGNQGGSGSENNVVDNNSRFKVFQEGKLNTGRQEWSELKELDVFSNEYFNYQSIIAPGVRGTYNFSVENQNDVKFNYGIEFTQVNPYNINLKYKLKLNGQYIVGNENEWVSLEQLNRADILLNSRANHLYTIEWKWIDAENDTEIGRTERANYKMYVKVDGTQVK